LSLAQAREVISVLDDGTVQFEVLTFETKGDRDRTTPIDETEGSDFFTDAVEEALLKGSVDIAVHSAKDMPDRQKKGLTVAVVTPSVDPDDVLVSRNGLKLGELPPGATVGTSSKRRKEAVKALRPDIRIADLRGNIGERLEKLDKGEFDAIVVAAAGLIRLGLGDRITERLPITGAKGQGSLAIEIRGSDRELLKWLGKKYTS